jgi:F0F1-type ATP synthase membrane subunit b/b'
MKRLTLAVFLFATALRADEKGDENATWKLVNFAILAVGVGYAMAKFLPPMFRSRTSEIQKGISEAQTVKHDAEKRAAAMDARLQALGSEIEKFRTQANGEMEQEAARIREETARQMAKLQQQVQAEIETAGKVASRELQAFAARLSLDLAEERVRARLDPAAENALVDGFVTDLGASRN